MHNEAAAGSARPRLRLPGGALWLMALVLAVGATQINSLEREFVNDEATAIVMAGHLLDGNLPYVKLIDNKPPMLFLLLAGAMAVFGESLLVVRAVGDFFLLMSAIAVFAIARRRTSSTAAGLGALMLIAIHAKGPGTATLAALPATAMAMWALWLLLARRRHLWAVAAAGLLLSLATLTRTNLGFLALACGVWLGVAPLRPSLRVRWRAVPVFAGAGLAPLGLLLLVYWWADALEAFYLAAVVVPLSFSSSMNMAQVLGELLQYMSFETQSAPQLFLPFSAAFAAGLAASILRLPSVRRRFAAAPQARQAAQSVGAVDAGKATDRADQELPWLVLLATLLAVLASGAAYLHYWLQLYPICALFCAYGIDWMRSRTVLRWAAYLLPAVILAGAAARSAPGAVRLATIPGHLSAQHSFKAAALAIDEERRRDDTIYAFGGQLIYWYLGLTPVSAVVHPGNLGHAGIMRPLAEAGRVGADEVGRILELRPTWLVVRGMEVEGRGYIEHYFSNRNVHSKRNSELGAFLLENEYRPFRDLKGGPRLAFRIYRRKDEASEPSAAPPLAQRSIHSNARGPGQGRRQPGRWAPAPPPLGVAGEASGGWNGQ